MGTRVKHNAGSWRSRAGTAWRSIAFASLSCFAFASYVKAVTVEDVLAATGIRNGVACVPDCGNGALALELTQKSGFLVLALDEDEPAVAATKEAALEAGLLGRSLYVQQGSLDTLPWADHYVDLLALPEKSRNTLNEAEFGEIMRVLTPVHGRAVFADNLGAVPDAAEAAKKLL